MKRDLILEELVIQEATNLKLFARKTELNKLVTSELNGDNKELCVYGQMTNDCTSKRAMFLIKKCAVQVYHVGTGRRKVFSGELNGSPKQFNVSAENRLEIYVSPIEKLLHKYKPSRKIQSTKIKKLVDFLQDKTQELVF